LVTQLTRDAIWQRPKSFWLGHCRCLCPLTAHSLGFYFSYAIPTVMFAIRRYNVSDPIRFGPWTMGKIGLTVNILAVAFCVFLIIFLPFPPFLPVTGTNMNYASPVFAAVMIFATLNYILRARKKFTGPIKEVSSETSSEEVAHESVVPEKHTANSESS